MTASYYVVRTIAGREFEAARALREQAFMSSYVPWVEKPGKRGTKQLALFSGYMFVRDHIPWHQCDSRHNRCVRDRLGNPLLIGPVSIGGICYPVRESELYHIAVRAAMIRTGDETEAAVPAIKVGDIGIMKSGPFEGHRGEIIAVHGREAEIALRLFNSVQPVRARVDALEAA